MKTDSAAATSNALLWRRWGAGVVLVGLPLLAFLIWCPEDVVFWSEQQGLPDTSHPNNLPANGVTSDEAADRRAHADQLSRCHSTRDGHSVQCERTPPCIYLATNGPWERRQPIRSFCQQYARVEDWQTWDPYVASSSRPALPDLLHLLEGKTLLIMGDSVMSQTWYALMCALENAGLSGGVEEDLDAYDNVWRTLRALPEDTSDYKPRAYNATDRWEIDGSNVWRVPNYNITTLAPRVNSFEPVYMRAWLEMADVVLTGFGLHYGTNVTLFDAHLDEAAEYFEAYGRRSDKVVLFREVSAQHFPLTGHFDAALHTNILRGPCEALTDAAHHQSVISYQNGRIREVLQTRPNIHLVPFYELTAPRFNAHHDGPGLLPIGHIARDCTHFCYSPAMFNAHFQDINVVLKAALQSK
eukprot:jgi/Chlat1/791/Chrsp104S01249